MERRALLSGAVGKLLPATAAFHESGGLIPGWSTSDPWWSHLARSSRWSRHSGSWLPRGRPQSCRLRLQLAPPSHQEVNQPREDLSLSPFLCNSAFKNSKLTGNQMPKSKKKWVIYRNKCWQHKWSFIENFYKSISKKISTVTLPLSLRNHRGRASN